MRQLPSRVAICFLLLGVCGVISGPAWGGERPYEKTTYAPMGPRVQQILGIPQGPCVWLPDLRKACTSIRDLKRSGGAVMWEPTFDLEPWEVAEIDKLVDRILTQADANELVDVLLGTLDVLTYPIVKNSTLAPEYIGFSAMSALMMKHAMAIREQNPAQAARWLRAAAFISACNEHSADGSALFRIKLSLSSQPELDKLLGISPRQAKELVALADEAQGLDPMGGHDSALERAARECSETLMQAIIDRSMTDKDFDIILKQLEQTWKLAGNSAYFLRLQTAVAGWSLKCFVEARKDDAKTRRVQEVLRSLADKHVRNAHERRWLLQAAEAPGPDPKRTGLAVVSGPYSPFFRLKRPE